MTSKKLPHMGRPTFTTTLPSSGKKVKYTSFSVKEEKLMLIAKESDDVESALNATEQIISGCCPDIHDPSELSIVDFTWLLIAIRSVSVNNRIEVMVTDDETGEQILSELNLDSVEIIRPEVEISDRIESDGLTLFIKHPGFRVFREFLNDSTDPELRFNVLVDSLVKIASEDEVYPFKSYTKAEMLEYIDTLPDYVVKHITNFYQSGISLRHNLKYTRESDGKERTLVIEGFDSFFI